MAVACLETYDPRANCCILQAQQSSVMPRAYYGIATVGNIIYYVGGYNGHGYLNATSAFHPVTRSWKELAPMYAKV